MEKNIIKIACLIGQLGNGGTEKQLYLFLKHLDRGKFAPLVIVSSKQTGSRWESRISNELGINIKFIGALPGAAKLAKFAWIVHRNRADIVFSWSFYTNAFCMACPGTRFIGSLRGCLGSAREQLGPANFRYSLKPEHFIVNSRSLSKELEDEGIPRDRISVIYNIYEQSNLISAEDCMSYRLKTRSSLGIPENSIVVAGIGKESPEKDIPFFLDVIAECSRTNPNVAGLLIGRFGKSTGQAVEERKLSGRIFFSGEVEDAVPLLCSADIFFLSSKSEGMPNSVIEALAAGCPVISTDVGGVGEIKELTGGDVKIITGRDPAIFAKAVLNMAGDTQYLGNKGDKDVKRLDFFSSENIMHNFYKLLERSN